MSATLDWIGSPADALRGDITVPGDKSVSHRAIMLAAIAEGASRINGFLEGADTATTAAIFQQLGVRIEVPATGERIVHGVGLHGLQASHGELDCGNAGTAMRLLTGLFAGQHFDCALVGDASLSRRPMRRVIEPLAQMGARIEANAGGLPPLRIQGGPLRGIEYKSPIASAQVKSAVLLAGLYAQGETQVYEPQPTRDYTERMLAAFGWPIEFEPGRAKLRGGHRLQATEVIVPTDFSSAAFFIVAAALVPGSKLRLRGVGLNPHAPLHGIEVPVGVVADMIDEFPIFFVAAAAAEGTTTIRGAQELRVKESDRIAVMASGLRTLGAHMKETPGGAVIEGGALRGGEVDAQGDHRCAMAFAVAGAIARGPLRVRDCANVATSFPGFEHTARTAGLRLEDAG